MCHTNNIDAETIRQALIKNAQLVERYGDAYLPTFLRLEEEYLQRKEENGILTRVAQYANGQNPESVTQNVTQNVTHF